MSDQADRLSRTAFLKAAGATAAAGTALGPLSSTARAAVRRTAATTELRVLMIAGQDKLWREIVKIWNASHDQKVKLSMSVDSNENIKTTYRTNLAGSNPPDMVFLFTGQRFIKDVADAGLVADLSSYAKKYKWSERYSPGVYGDLVYKGKLMQVPWAAAPHTFVWYNKELFTKLGLTVPANRRPTLAQFEGYVKASRDAGLEPVAIGDKDTWPGGHFVTMMALRAMSIAQLKELRPAFWGETKARWTDPGPIKALTLSQKAGQDGWFAQGFVGVSDGEAQQLFGSGKSTMYQAGYWGINVILAAAPKLQFDFFHYPQLDPKVPTAIINFANTGVAVSSKSKNAALIAGLLNYAISKQGQRLVFEKFSQYPSTKLLGGLSGLKYTNPLWPALIREIANTPNTPFQLENDTPPSVAPRMLANIQGLLTGSISPDSWAKTFQSGLDRTY
jgi:raffinose/stachyose/melibiose transport system substrate-binding protein